MTKKANSVSPADAVAVISIALVIGISYWFFMPQLKRLEQHKAAAQVKAAEAKQLQERYTALVSLTDELPQAKTQLDLLTIAYPKEQQTAEAMIQLQSMAGRSGLAISSLVPSQARDGVLSVTGSYKGTYGSYLTFLKALSGNVRPATVRNLTVTTESDAQRTNLTANITVDFPYDQAAVDALSIVEAQ
jgi:Tfp pilus assembly protein PilO